VSGSTKIKIAAVVLAATFALVCAAADAAVRSVSVSYNPNPTGPSSNAGPPYPNATAIVSYDDQAGTISLTEKGALTYPDNPMALTFPLAAEWSWINGLTFSHCSNTPGSAVSTAGTDPIIPEAFYDSNGNVSVAPLEAMLTDSRIAGLLSSSTPELSDGGSTVTTAWSSPLLANQNFTCVHFSPGGFAYGQPPYSGGVSFGRGLYYFTGYGPASKAVWVTDCTHEQFQPKEIVLTCADAHRRITHLKWSSWSGLVAHGSGMYVANTCTPSCVQGRFVHYRIRVTLSEPSPCPGQAHGVFKRAVLTTTARHPRYLFKRWRLSCPTS
jgi:hypothetical protein